MKNKCLLLFLGIVSFTSKGQLSNGGFESYGSLPTCTTDYSITKCSNWDGLKTTYTSCGTYTDVKGSSSDVDYFNSTSGGTSGCDQGDPRTGTGHVHCEQQGYFGGGTAKNELIYQALSGTLLSSKSYKVTAYFNTLSTWSLSSSTNGLSVGACFVNQSVGSGANQIMGDVRGQTYVEPTKTDAGSGWIKIERIITPPSNGSYYLVLGAMLFCNDANYTETVRYIIDDVTVEEWCPTADAGPDKTIMPQCDPTSAVIGTAAKLGFSYSWATSTGLSCTNCAQPTATPGSTTTYTVSVTGTCSSTATDKVIVTVDWTACRKKPVKEKNVITDVDVTSFSVFPNPSNSYIEVSIPENLTECAVKIYGIDGRLMLQQTYSGLKNEKIKIDTNPFPAGIYFIHLLGGNSIQHMEKLLITK